MGARRRRPRSAKHRAASVSRKTMETIDEAQGFDGNDSMSYSNPAFQGGDLIPFSWIMRIRNVDFEENNVFLIS